MTASPTRRVSPAALLISLLAVATAGLTPEPAPGIAAPSTDLAPGIAVHARRQILVGGSATIEGPAHADFCFAKDNGDCLGRDEMLALANGPDGDTFEAWIRPDRVAGILAPGRGIP